MSIIDIVVISLIALFAVTGVIKGIKKSALSLVAFLVSFVIAFFTAKVIAEALLGVEAIRNFVIGTDGWSLYLWIFNGFKAGELSEMAKSMFYQPIMDIISPYTFYTVEFTIEQGFAMYVAFLMFSAIVGVAMFLIVRLLLTIVTMIVKSFFEKRVSGVGRLLGLFSGAVRGLCWSLALMIVLSTMGGLTFLAPFQSIENEFTSSVISKHINQWAYTIRDKAYLPDINMYDRVIKLSGIKPAEEEEKDETLLGERLELYCDFMNLNYESGAPYVINTNTGFLEKPDDPSVGLIDHTEFETIGFDRALKAIMDYNMAAAEKIYNREISDVDDATVARYINIVWDDNTDSIYQKIIAGKALLTKLRNYNNKAKDPHNQQLTSEDALQQTNADMITRYNEIIVIFGEIQNLYSELQSTFGTLTLELPDAAVQFELAEA